LKALKFFVQFFNGFLDCRLVWYFLEKQLETESMLNNYSALLSQLQSSVEAYER